MRAKIVNLPKVSIVTISFNQAEFLRRTINSVLEQTYANLEYIVVDPGSTDGSRDIINEHRSRFAKIIFEPDAGAADGLNKGFSAATGDIFGFLNSDDLLLPGAVASAVGFLDTHTNIDVVSGHSNLIDSGDCFLRRLYSDRMSVTRFLYEGVILMQPSTFFRREIYNRTGGFNSSNRICWDGELFLDMALAGAKFALVNEFWSAYRIHPQSVTGSKSSVSRVKQAQAAIFQRVRGRRRHTFDQLLTFGCILLRKLLNPADTLERIRRGPAFGRYA